MKRADANGQPAMVKSPKAKSTAKVRSTNGNGTALVDRAPEVPSMLDRRQLLLALQRVRKIADT